LQKKIRFTEATKHHFVGSIYSTYNIQNMILFIINETVWSDTLV